MDHWTKINSQNNENYFSANHSEMMRTIERRLNDRIGDTEEK